MPSSQQCDPTKMVILVGLIWVLRGRFRWQGPKSSGALCGHPGGRCPRGGLCLGIYKLSTKGSSLKISSLLFRGNQGLKPVETPLI